MSGYIFTPPAAAYDMTLTYEGALEYIGKGRNEGYRKIGTTVEVTHWHAGQVTVRLYGTIIATILSNGTVAVSEAINSYPRLATTWWVQKVLSDNGVGGLVGRVKGEYPQAGKVYTRNI